MKGILERLENDVVLGAEGCVPVPDGPGLGVELDWDWIKRHEVGVVVYE